MGLFKSIRQVIFGYTVVSRSNQTVKIQGITYTHAKVQLFRKEGIHEVLLLSVSDQPITLCALLTSGLKQQILSFFNDAWDLPEAQLLIPLHHQPVNLKFQVYNKPDKKRKWIISQGIQKKYSTLTDTEIDLANNYFHNMYNKARKS